MLITCKFLRWSCEGVRGFSASSRDNRFASLDGLRGILSASVFVSHASTYHAFYVTNGKWDWPDSKLHTFLGQAPVVIFFMLTGFLFWPKIASANLDVQAYFVNRFRRIMPMYLTLVCLVLLIIAIKSDFKAAVPISQLARELLFLSVPLRGWPTVNGVSAGFLMAMVWTIRFECGFYIIIPVLRIAISKFGKIAIAAVFVLGLLFVQYFFPIQAVAIGVKYWLIFPFGICVAMCSTRKLFESRSSKTILSFVSCICLCLAYSVSEQEYYNFTTYFCLAIVLFCVANGGDFFGLLLLPSTMLLGKISYSIYVLHLVTLYVCLQVVSQFRSVSSMNATSFWIAAISISSLLTIVSCLTYWSIEKRYLRTSTQS